MNFSNMDAMKGSALLLPIMSRILNGRLKSTARNVITLAAHVKDLVMTNVNLVAKMVIVARLLTESLHLVNVSAPKTWRKSTVFAT